MRWNALPMLALAATLVLAGCVRRAVQTQTDVQSSATIAGDLYTPTPPQEAALQPDSYLDYSPPGEVVEPADGADPYLTDTAQPRYHVVANKETLYALARMYYHDARRWKDIFEANRATIDDPDRILIGQRLLIP